jgi:glycosyl transferase family 25
MPSIWHNKILSLLLGTLWLNRSEYLDDSKDDLLMKMQTYVINLDRSADRWQRIHSHLSDLGVAHERVDAIDAQSHSLDESGYNPERNTAEYFLPLKSAEVACYMSHLKALKQFLADPSVEYGLILEDDVELLEASEGMESIANWLGCNDAGVVKLYSKRRVFGNQVGRLSNTSILKPWRIPLGFQAQLWNRLAAQEFVNKYASFYQPVDVEFQFNWRYGFSVYLVDENKVRELSAQVGGSTISPSKKKLGWAKLRLEVVRPWFRFKLLLKATGYALTVYRGSL